MNPLAFPLVDARTFNRRTFLAGAASLAGAALWSNHARGAVTGAPKFTAYPFSLGVASGDPTSDGAVLWTRLAPEPLTGGGMPPTPVTVAWEVAEDEAMSKIVRSGSADATPEWAHSVHVEVEGLEPARWYWYRFKSGSAISPIGRTRTMPAEGATPDRLRFAFASCQHFETGLYTAYEHMLRENLDLVFHLGDYIYEGAGLEQRVRKHVGPELTTLDDYRNRHAQYKSDPALQAMHAAAPWVVTWDDHEFYNNCTSRESNKAQAILESWTRRRAAAYQAYYEHMPLRRSAIPKGADMLLYRRVPFGQLANFFVLDTRQYRSDQPCGDGNKEPCPEAMDPNATVLGTAQRNWLFDGLGKSAAGWNVLAQQIMIARVDRKSGPDITHSMDQWPGYEVDRQRLLKFLEQRRVSNPIAIAGDIHSNWANDLVVDFDGRPSRPVASEFVGTSISSGGDGLLVPKTRDATLSENPFVKFHSAERGYVCCEVTPRLWRTDFRAVEYVSRPGAPLLTRASFVVEPGKPAVQNA